MTFAADAVSVLAASVVQNGMLHATHSTQAMIRTATSTAHGRRGCREVLTRLF